MEDRCDAAWLAAYALGLVTAGRDDRTAIHDLAGQVATNQELFCQAIDRLATCTVGSVADRQRAIDLLARAADVATTHAGGSRTPDLEIDLTHADLVRAADGRPHD